MGAFGPIRYAEIYPDRFNFSAARSSALDLLDLRIQTPILGSIDLLAQHCYRGLSKDGRHKIQLHRPRH